MTAPIQSYMAVSSDRTSSEISLSHQSPLHDFNHDDDEESFAVVAPCDMDEGYTFMVTTNEGGGEDDVIPVTVPPGGIRQGQLFYSTPRSFRNNGRSKSFNSSTTTLKIGSISSNISEWTPLIHQQSNNEVEFGDWKDHWFDCFRLGFCHATLWNAICCPQILAAQVLSRLHLNWLGDPIVKNIHTDRFQRTISRKATRQTFYYIVLLVITYWCLTTWTDPNHLPGPTSLWLNNGLLLNDFIKLRQNDESNTFYIIVNLMFGTYTLFLFTKLRYHTRRIHHIPSSNLLTVIYRRQKGKDAANPNIVVLDHDDTHATVEDCCMALCCGSCSVAQMARQTASYYEGSYDDVFDVDDHQYDHAVCCSIDGLPQSPRYNSSYTSNSSISVLAA